MIQDTRISFPTEAELKLYHKGKLTARRRYEIENLALENEMVMDAIEGYSHLEQMRLQKQRYWKHGVALGFIGIIVSLFFIPKEETPVTRTIAPAIVERGHERSVKSLQYSEPADRPVRKIEVKSILEPSALPSPEQILIQPLQKKEPVDSLVFVINEKPRLADDGLSDRGVKLMFIERYKLREYTFEKKEESELINTHPALENKADQASDLYNTEKKYSDPNATYHSLAIQLIQSFDAKDWSNTIIASNKILEMNANDVNALFYGGMAAYHSNLYEIALSKLTFISVNQLPPFAEEATYYRALSLIESQQLDEGYDILAKIADSDGFYAKAARNFLSK
jgi:hypothetical protein